MFSTAHHEHRAAALAGKPAPALGPVTPAMILQQAQAACRTSLQYFRSVMADTLSSMHFAAACHERLRRPFSTDGDAALLTELSASLAFMQAVASINQDDAVICFDAFENKPLTDAHRDIFDRSPALAAWQAAREARCAKMDLQQAEARERDAQARRDARPGELIAALTARGVTLAVDGKGHITAMPGDAVTTGEIADVVEHKLALVAILTAPAPAAPAPPRPMVLA